MDNKNYLYIFLISAAYALEFFFGKLAVQHVDYINLIIQRYILVGIILFILAMIFKRKDFIESVNKKSIMYSFLIGLSSVIGGAFLYLLFKSESFAKIIPMIEPLIVIISFILGIVFLKEKFTYRLLGGVILVIVGVYLINSSK